MFPPSGPTATQKAGAISGPAKRIFWLVIAPVTFSIPRSIRTAQLSFSQPASKRRASAQ